RPPRRSGRRRRRSARCRSRSLPSLYDRSPPGSIKRGQEAGKSSFRGAAAGCRGDGEAVPSAARAGRAPGSRGMDGVVPGLAREPAFPGEEYRARLERVRGEMRVAGLEALLVHHPPNVLYLSGYQSFSMYEQECLVVPPQGEPILLVPE